MLRVALSILIYTTLFCDITSYLQKSASDVSNFDTDFTMERAALTPPDKELLKTMDQGVFLGFSFTNPDMTKL